MQIRPYEQNYIEWRSSKAEKETYRSLAGDHWILLPLVWMWMPPVKSYSMGLYFNRGTSRPMALHTVFDIARGRTEGEGHPYSNTCTHVYKAM